MKQATELTCKRCGGLFECNSERIESCQCHSVHLKSDTLNVLQKTTWGCLCKNCLQNIDHKLETIKKEKFPTSSALQEAVHYYIQDGLWVFTEYYHMLRGYCCKSGCRHCPYGFKKEDNNKLERR